MELKEIKEYFKEHKDEFESYIGEMIPDRVKTYLDTDEGQKIMRPYIDKNFEKGLKTWQENNLKKIVDEEVNKRYPAETEEKKALRELQQKFEQLEKEKRTEQQRNKAITYATQKGLPLDIIDHFVGDDDEKTTENLSKLEKSFTEHLKKTVDGVFKQGGGKPGGPDGGGAGKFTRESLKKMSPDEVNANWDAIEKQLSEGKI